MTPDYFEALSTALREAGHARPCLVIDRERLDHNIARVRARAHLPVRVVAKSLACLPLLDRVCTGLGSIGFMTFSATMLETLLVERPTHHHLMGKPLPLAAVEHVLVRQRQAAEQVIWLVDTPHRAKELADLAHRQNCTLRVAFELDVGMHRGGLRPHQLAEHVHDLKDLPRLIFEGVMGYEPHLAKLPWPFLRGAQRRVGAALQTARDYNLVNTAGSMTFDQYRPGHGATEISLGSLALKPSDFDLPSTAQFEPAMFIATPILKYLPSNPMPGPSWLTTITGRWLRADLAIYGGYWPAQPVHPHGFKYSSVFGHSSNQEVWSGPKLPRSPVDQFAFLRPTQSEAVLPMFGDVVLVSQGSVVDHWPCLPVGQ